MNNNDTNTKELSKLRLAKDLGEELGKSIYKQLTINEKYTSHDFTYFENKTIIEYMYAKIYELLYNDQYGKKESSNNG